MADRIFIGGGGADFAAAQAQLLRAANRHGLIAGATGTGKTVTLQILAEGFSAAGVPVFLSDVKGDLSGLCQPGSAEGKLHAAFVKRAETIRFADYGYEGFPTVFWDLFGAAGHPVRTTATEMGPLLLSRLLELTEAQEGVLNIAFRVADEEGLLLIDLKDLQAMLVNVGERAKELSLRYGNIAPATVGSIQRRLLVLEGEGGAAFFGEPALDLADMIRVGPDGRGQVNLLAADRLMRSPRLYATFLLWLLSELFETLPEVGDPEKPVFVFFFDEAHLLFDGAPKALVDKVEQVARLIRSKGVGVYFVTQSPADVPEPVLAQLGNRVQHALRAYTPGDQKAVRAAAASFRANPGVDVGREIQELGVGEALVSTLDAKGAPSPVARTKVRPPNSRVGPASPAERAAVRAATGLGAKYDPPVDRTSAYELLTGRADAARKEAEQAAKEREKAARTASKAAPAPSRSRRREPPSMGEVAAKLGETAMRDLSRELMRGLFGGMKRKRR